MKEKILFFIPARGGSKGIPKKNIANLAGKPLISYVLDTAINVISKLKNYDSRLIVSTDDSDIAKIAENIGAEIPFIRPKSLASDNSLDIDVIKHALKYLDDSDNYSPDFMIELAATSPFVIENDILSALKLYEKHKCPIVSVVKNEKPIHWNYFIKNSQLINVFDGEFPARRQDAQDTYRLNGAICIASNDFLMKNDGFICHNTIPYLMPSERSVDIDFPLDLDLAEVLIKKDNLK
mgnify:CR=1 FL=1